MMIRTSVSSFLLLLVLSNTAFALSQANHFELVGALGAANLRAGNGQLGVTSSETDTLSQTNKNNWNTFATQLGLGYIYYFHQSEKTPKNVQWFPAIEPELNLYYLSSNSNIEGQVFRFGNPAFNDFNYKIPVHSTRLMLDAVLTVVKKRSNSLYVKAGIGNAWNRVAYNDSENNNGICPEQNINLAASTNSNFAWELGIGVIHDFNDRIGLSLEYLYTHFGTVNASGGYTGPITAAIISAPRFNLESQTALLGLHIALA